MNITRFTPYALSLFYFLFFAWMGIQIPYFNLYLYHAGLSPAEIGAVAAAFPLVRIFAPGLWGYLADRFDRRGLTAPLLWGASTLAFSLLFFADRFIPILCIVVVFTFFWSPTLPLAEASAMKVVQAAGVDYGRMRVWGTIGFISFAALTGKIVDLWPIETIIAGMVLLLLCNAMLAWRLPASRGGGTSLTFGAVFSQLRRPEVVRFLAVAMLMLVSHSAYYGFFSIYLESLGYSRGTMGLLWALGPIGEIVVMLKAKALLQRYGAERLLSFSLLAAVVRWTIFALSGNMVFLIPAQLLHAFTFGAYHIASVRHVEDLFPEGMKNTGQALYSSSAYGAGLVVGSLASGLLYDRIGAPMLFLLSALAAFVAFRLNRRA